MRLTKDDKARLRCWKEGQCCDQDDSRPNDTQHVEPMLPKIAFGIVSRLTHRAKTARGKLRRAAKACGLILDFLDQTQTPRRGR